MTALPGLASAAPSGLAAPGTRRLSRISSSLEPSEALQSIRDLLLVRTCQSFMPWIVEWEQNSSPRIELQAIFKNIRRQRRWRQEGRGIPPARRRRLTSLSPLRSAPSVHSRSARPAPAGPDKPAHRCAAPAGPDLPRSPRHTLLRPTHPALLSSPDPNSGVA